MKVVILAGGKGTRLVEETITKPKPMVEIGQRPILWHIMSHYAHHGFRDFVVACGYRGEVIVDYFKNFHLYDADVTFSLASGEITKHNHRGPDWNVSLAWTGLETQTGGRLQRLSHLLDEEPFMVTYGDCVSNVELRELVRFHEDEGRMATVTAVRPPSRYGVLDVREHQVASFDEKPQLGGEWINGGFMVLEPEVLSRIEGDDTILERGILEALAREGQLAAFLHEGFWQPMDNLRERNLLESLWQSGEAPWKVWKG